MSQITTHVLDTSAGHPAAGIKVILLQQNGDDWLKIATATTNDDGRIPDLLPAKEAVTPGVYKLHFQTGSYFSKLSTKTFYPFVEIFFTIDGQQHYHVPLLLNPYGYSTYRGS